MIQVKEYINLLKDFHAMQLKGENCEFSSACYEWLVSKNKVSAYDSEEMIEIRSNVYKQLKSENNEVLMKIKEDRPDYFKNNIIRMCAQSLVVNAYLSKFKDFESVLINLELI